MQAIDSRLFFSEGNIKSKDPAYQVPPANAIYNIME
jgi:hypothetical protein